MSAAARRVLRRCRKCDLMTRMVGEFPELQGVMGRYYAHGERRESPKSRRRSTSSTRRASPAMRSRKAMSAQVLAVAERLDTLAGIFRGRPETLRQQGSVRAAPRGAWARAHADRRRHEARSGRAAARSGRSRHRSGRGRLKLEAIREVARHSSTSCTILFSTACAATTPTRAFAAKHSTPCARSRRTI